MKAARILSVALVYSCAVLAADQPNFSGTYNQQKPKPPKPHTLRVSQSQIAIEVTSENAGKTAVTRVPLDGSAVECTTPSGAAGKCRAQIDGSQLTIESNVFTRTEPNGPLARMHLRQDWQLSADGKTLTIRNQIDSPQISPEVLSIIAPNNPWTETYERVK
jgi:hypothetical protein